MDRRQLLVGTTAMGLAGQLNLNQLLSAQNIETGSQVSDAPQSQLTARESAGLHGPVKICVEENTSEYGKSATTTEYSLDGQFLSSRDEMDGRPSDAISSSDYVQTEVRDSNGRGRVAKLVYGKVGEPPSETLFTYDDAGRLLTQINSGHDRMEFHYQTDGSKTSTLSFDPKTIEGTRSAAFGGSAWEGITSGFGVPVGGYVTTTYDKNDYPIELQVRTADGQRITRMVRTYDDKGRLIEEKTLEKNLAFLMLERMPTEHRARLGPDEVRAFSEQVNRLGIRPDGATYTYDSEGRVIKKCERNMVFERTTTTDYNEQGDKAHERETFKDNSGDPQVLSHPRPNSDVRYDYRYDSYGNWIERMTTRSDGFTLTTRREITYY